jgi:hypothetical protein
LPTARQPSPARADPFFVYRDRVRGAHHSPQQDGRHQDAHPAEKINILFFGSYTNANREDYINEMMKVLSSEEETYRRLTADLYDHGKVLRDDKFSWLYWSFTLFLLGMVLTACAVVYQLCFTRASRPRDTIWPCRPGPVRFRSRAPQASGAPRPGSTIQSGWQK